MSLASSAAVYGGTSWGGIVLRDPWKVLRQPPPNLDAQAVFERSRALLRQIDETCGDLLSAGSSQPRVEPDQIAVDVWVSDTVHAGSFLLSGKATLMVQMGVVDVVDHLPQFLAQVVAQDGRPSPQSVHGFSRWLDWAASLADKVVLPIDGPLSPDAARRLAGPTVQAGNVFVLAHELAHLYAANDHEMQRTDATWRNTSPRQRAHRLEHLADALALDATMEWARAVWTGDGALRLAYTGVWASLHGVGLLEQFDPKRRPSSHPSALQRLEALEQRAQQRYGPVCRSADALGLASAALVEPGMDVAVLRRERARLRLQPLVDELKRGPVAQRRVARTVGKALLESHTQTLATMAHAWRHPEEDPSGRVAAAFRDVMFELMPVRVYNSLGNVYATHQLEPLRRHRTTRGGVSSTR